MKYISLTLFTIFTLFLVSQATRVIPVKDPNNILVTFGSCNKYYGHESDDVFYKIADLNPDVWIWLGDVAYVDEKIMPPIFGYAGEEKIKEKFHAAKTSPPYVKLRDTCPIIGVWDDHDYGLNNAGKTFAYKNVTQQLWLDFMDEPADSIRRKREGVYESYYIGDSSKIKVILLDVRYFKDERYIVFSTGQDTLGEQQWQWLENELKTNKAQYILIGSGTQMLPDDRLGPEHWFPESRNRLLSLIKKYQTSGVVFLSGDVHFAEILKHPCKERIGYEQYEFTSSGLTHHVASHVPLADHIVNTLFPKTFNKNEDKYLRENFGVLKFTFGEKSSVKFEARDLESKIVLEKTLNYDLLKFNAKNLNEKSQCILDKSPFLRFAENYVNALLTREWFAYASTILVFAVILILIKFIQLSFWLIRKICQVIAGKPVKKEKQA